MQIEFLLGKAKTGKSTYIYSKIKENVDFNKKSILFVPSQKRAITEENYMKQLKLKGIIGVNITTISSFILEKLKNSNLNYDESKLTKLDKKILLSKTILENNDIFDTFAGVKNKQGFIENIYMYMDIFKKENINVEKLKNISLGDKILENKLSEVVKLYSKYLSNMNESFSNTLDEIELFIQKISNKYDFSKVDVFFDGYNNFTNTELLFIETLLKGGASVTISLTTDISSVLDIQCNNTNPIFEVPNSTYMKLLKICNRNNILVENNIFIDNKLNANKSIKYLADNIFSNSKNEMKKVDNNSVSIYLKKDIYSEIRTIAEDIKKKIKDNNRYKDFVIYTTNVEQYSSIIQRIFYEYNIPYYLDNKKSIEKSCLVIYIKKYIAMLSEKVTYEKIIEILKLGLNDISLEKVSELENYVTEFNLGKNTLNKEITINNKKDSDYIYDIDALNQTRDIINNIFSMPDNLKLTNTSVIIDTLYEHLIKNNVLELYNESLQKKKEVQDSFFEEQVWENIVKLLESISNIYKRQKISMSDFFNIFKIGLSECYIKSIPPTIDCVSILDIDVSKSNEKKFSYFVGVNEGVFPREVQEDIFFSDIEIEKLSNKNIEFKKSSISKYNMELYNIYEAISNTTDCLKIYILSSDILGKSLRKSNLVTIIKNILDIKILGDVTEENVQNKNLSKEKLFEELVNSIKDKKFNLKTVALIKYFENEKKYNEILHYKKNDENLNDNSIKILYGKDLKTSVSKLELFKKCPFSYFIEYSLNIKPNVEYKITNLDTGTFMHDVLDRFSNYLLKNNVSWHEILVDGESLNEIYINKLNDILEEDFNVILKRHKENIKFIVLKQKLLNTMQNVITVIAKSFNQSEFIPLGYEIEFKNGSIYAPMEIKISDDKNMQIIGKIDRVDILKEDDTSYIRVVDYKSSQKTLEIDSIKEGISLQLMTYLMCVSNTLEKKGQNVIPAACVYFNLSDKLINLMDYTDDDEKLKTEIVKKLRLKGIYLKDIKILEKMDNKISDNSKRLIDVSKSSINRPSQKLLEKEKFFELSKEVQKILKDIGDQILNGVVKISPNRKADYCKYCKYACICRKNSCM